MEAVQPVRVKYIKFSSAMDIALLELIQIHNPIAAKHGTRLAMWERVAREFGSQIFDNPAACKWQICRDRGNLLLRWFEEGKFDKLFKDDNDAQNKKKETLLLALRHATAAKQGSTSPPSPTSEIPIYSTTSIASPPMSRDIMFPAESPHKRYRPSEPIASYQLPSLVVQPLTLTPPQGNAMPAIVVREKYLPKQHEDEMTVDHPLPSLVMPSRKRKASDVNITDVAAQFVRVVEQKLQTDMDMRQRDQQLRAQELNMQHQLLDYLDNVAVRRRLHLREGGGVDSDEPDVASQLLQLLQHKMQIDMQHNATEMKLRADEVELQRRVMAYLARC
ncbi:unnamed protein product [Aphanomyces euteiches]